MTPDGTSLNLALGPLREALTRRQLTICAAESCTGGLICAALTEQPGSSAYFVGGVVTYSNHAKLAQLGVRQESLRRHGAVSREVAQEMVLGVRAMFGADVALSVTGVAGPGAEGEKPVGLTFIGCSVEGRVEVRQYDWTADRAGNRFASVEAAFALATEILSAQDYK